MTHLVQKSPILPLIDAVSIRIDISLEFHALRSPGKVFGCSWMKRKACPYDYTNLPACARPSVRRAGCSTPTTTSQGRYFYLFAVVSQPVQPQLPPRPRAALLLFSLLWPRAWPTSRPPWSVCPAFKKLNLEHLEWNFVYGGLWQGLSMPFRPLATPTYSDHNSMTSNEGKILQRERNCQQPLLNLISGNLPDVKCNF